MYEFLLPNSSFLIHCARWLTKHPDPGGTGVAVRLRFDVHDHAAAVRERRQRCRALPADHSGSIVEHQVHGLSRFVADAEVLAAHVDDGAAQFPRCKGRRALMTAAGDGGRDGGEGQVNERAPHAVTISAAVVARRPWKVTNSAGSTISVSAAAENRPPMITTASGRCTSDPMACEIAIGISP